MDKVKLVAEIARERLHQIPFAKQENIDFREEWSGDPSTYYEWREDGYYEVVSERGSVRELKVAATDEEMIEHFIYKAIRDYAFKYERSHRHRYESNLRQTHTIMEFCYSFIGSRKIYDSAYYEDENHICLDLLEDYRSICNCVKENYRPQYLQNSADIHFLLDKKYAGPSGGISDVPKAIKDAHDCILRIAAAVPQVREEVERLEKYYKNIRRGF